MYSPRAQEVENSAPLHFVQTGCHFVPAANYELRAASVMAKNSSLFISSVFALSGIFLIG